MKRMLATAAAAALALSLTAGPAMARPVESPPADGACVAAGVKNLRGAIGGVASTSGAGTIAGVILAHTNGDGSVSGASC
jgi:hypothetical protein